MNWEYLKDTIYNWDGAWRDIYIKETNTDDWKKWTAFVNSSYELTWYNSITDREEDQIDFEQIDALLKGKDELRSTANIFLESIQINCHFFEADNIENDIDPREFNSAADHIQLINYMKALSKLLQKPVHLTPENTPDIILITVDKETVTISDEVDPSGWNISPRI